MKILLLLSLVLILPLQSFSSSREGQRILIQAILANDVSAVKQTLQLKFDINEKSDQGHYPIHMAVRKEVKDEILEALLKAGAQPDLRNRKMQTPLHIALSGNSSRKVELLLKADANPSLGDRLGNTPLHIAAEGKASPQLLHFLLHSKKVQVNLKNGRGYTPLMLASLRFSPNSTVVKELLEAGADPAIITLGKFTALDFAQGMLDFFRKRPEEYGQAISEQEKIVSMLSGQLASQQFEKAK